MKLTADRFKCVLRDTVLVALDLLIVKEDEILLGRRRNSPAKGLFFVPGGRIYKGESPETALMRISHGEVGTEFRSEDATLQGVYHHVYDDNYFSDPEILTTE